MKEAINIETLQQIPDLYEGHTHIKFNCPYCGQERRSVFYNRLHQKIKCNNCENEYSIDYETTKSA